MQPTRKELLSTMKELVRDDARACDFESGFCRFCLALVESADPEELEAHQPYCPWSQARTLLGMPS